MVMSRTVLLAQILFFSETTGSPTLSLSPLVPLTTQVNASQQNTGTEHDPHFVPQLSANPVYGTAIQQFTIVQTVSGYMNVPVLVTGAAPDTARTG